METMNDYDYKVELWEDKIKRDENGTLIHHPLNSRYYKGIGPDNAEDYPSYGHLTFAGHDLDKSPILGDIKVFYLEFKGILEETYDKEEWADPLRADVLKHLSGNKRSWYISMIDRRFTGVGNALTKLVGTQLNQINVKSEDPFGFKYGFSSREFYEIPNHNLPEIVRYFWSEAVPGNPIEGYNLETGKIEVLRQWDARPRDDQLFRDVIDQTFVNFYTFPAENRFFVFVTNKLNYAELATLIRLEELQERAKEIGRENK